MRGQVVAMMLAGLSGQAVDDGSLRLTNIEVHLRKIGTAASSRIDARVINPNSFSVFNITANCVFGDQWGNIVGSDTVTIVDAIKARGARHILQFDLANWPSGASAAKCLSSSAKRLSD